MCYQNKKRGVGNAYLFIFHNSTEESNIGKWTDLSFVDFYLFKLAIQI